MPPKKAKGKKAKAQFNPFIRVGAFTAPIPESVPVNTQPFPGSFVDSSLTITPALPRTEVSLKIQFRCTVDISVGDVLFIHLPNFKGAARPFSLESVPHPDDVDMARYFLAYWSGDAKIKGKKGAGAPGKQVLYLRCVHPIDENQLVAFGVPSCLSLISPDKLAANSSKMRVEGQSVQSAEGKKIPRQAFLSCSEIKKRPIAEELSIYESAMNEIVDANGLSEGDRHVGEEVQLEEADQLWQSAMYRQPYAVEIPWVIAPTVFHSYEDTGEFVKLIMENAVRFIKAHDALALHREVAKNWGVKVGSLVVLEDVLAMQHASMYPTVGRSALLAAHLLTMEPCDVARTFMISSPPATSIMQELSSALRMQHTIGMGSDASGIPSRCEMILNRWAAFISTLLTASMEIPASDAEPASYEPNSFAEAAEDEGEGASSPGSKSSPGSRPTVSFQTPQATSDEEVQMLPAPPLFVGIRDVPPAELQHVRELPEGEWYMFPGFTMARQCFPISLEPVVEEDEHNNSATDKGFINTQNTTNNNDDNCGMSDDGSFSVPDNAVIFEIRNAVEGLELTDLSLYPYNREWLLPFSSSYRVISVTVLEHHNDLTHVVLDMTGSLCGPVKDEFIPEGDRTVARTLARKLDMAVDFAESRVPHVATLTYLNVRLNDRRRLHPPTLMRAQYVSNYQEVMRASAAKETTENGDVLWQVCVNPAQMLEEGVVKAAVWEPIHRRYATAVELFFLGRTRTRTLLEDTGIIVNLVDYTADYGGRGPRPIRRLVGKRVTHEAAVPHVYEEYKAIVEANQKQMNNLNKKLGLTPEGEPLPNAKTSSRRK